MQEKIKIIDGCNVKISYPTQENEKMEELILENLIDLFEKRINLR